MVCRGREALINLDDRRKQLYKYSGEEWLEVMIRGEEDNMIVHMGAPWLVACNCCRDCCNWLAPLRMYSAEPWEGVGPSPYRAVVNSEACEGCTQDCSPRCAFKVIEIVKDPSTGKTKAYIDPDKCVGCGQCVIGCKVQGAIQTRIGGKGWSPCSRYGRPVKGSRKHCGTHLENPGCGISRRKKITGWDDATPWEGVHLTGGGSRVQERILGFKLKIKHGK